MTSLASWIAHDPETASRQFEKQLGKRSLAHFFRLGWHVLEPATPLEDNWHIDAVCTHLQAAFEGWIRKGEFPGYQQLLQNLLINIPPGTAKSRMLSVYFPAWSWLHWPSFRWIFLSSNPRVALRDSVYCRNLIESRWYADTFEPEWTLADDQNAKSLFNNTAGGFRQAMGFSARITGDRADGIAWDDPHDAEEVQSVLARQEVLDRWDDAIGNRVNDLRRSLRFGIMQRLHEEDLSGHVLIQGGWGHVNLPMEYEQEKACKCPDCQRGETAIGWRDPRSKEGELLFATRFPPEVLASEMVRLGPIGYAGQMQQRPMPKGGVMFQRHWFEIVPTPDPSFFTQLVRYWDKAGTQDGGAFTVGLLMGKGRDGKFYVINVVRAQLAAGPRKALIKQTAEADAAMYGGRQRVVIWQEQEPGSGGKEQAETQTLDLAGFPVFTERVTGHKETRAIPLAAQAYGGDGFGNVRICAGLWNTAYLDEMVLFPRSKYKDQVDGSSGAFNKLTIPPPDNSKTTAVDPRSILGL